MMKTSFVYITFTLFFSQFADASIIFANSKCSGFTPIKIVKENLIINGYKKNLKAVSYSTPKKTGTNRVDLFRVSKDFRLIKQIGFNTIRGYEPFSKSVLDIAEKENLYVVQALFHLSDETNFDSKIELKEIINQSKAIVERDLCNKSIVLWSLWNDAPFNWGVSGGDVVERFGYKTVHNFFKTLRDEIKLVDTLRPLTAANVLNAKNPEIGMDLLDLIGLNAYLGIYDWPSQRYSHAFAKKTIKRIKNISKKYMKPVWISETGISTIPGSENPENIIPAQIKLIEEANFVGFTIFQWQDNPLKAISGKKISHDIEANWGLMNSKGIPKTSIALISAAIKNNSFNNKQLRPKTLPSWSIRKTENYNLKKIKPLDNFKYKDKRSLNLDYKIISKGKSRGYFWPTTNSKNGLSLRYVAEDFGAWFVFGKKLKNPISIEDFNNLIINFGQNTGERINFSITLKLSNSKELITPPLLLETQKKRSYSLNFKHLRIGKKINVKNLKIKEIIFEINDVANFEKLNLPTTILIQNLFLSKDN